MSMLPSPLLDEHGGEIMGGTAALSPRAVRSPHSSHGAMLCTTALWDCSQKAQHPNLDQDGTALEPFHWWQAQIGFGEARLLPTTSQERATEKELLLAKGTRLHSEFSFLQAAS